MKHIHFLRKSAFIGLTVFAAASQAQFRGPSSSQDAYLLPAAPGVRTVSILTVGDFVNLKPDGTPYYFVGIPDGTGAWAQGNGTFNFLVNHELVGTAGIVRRHGETGSFVSNWKIHSRTLRVIKGEDLIHTVENVSGTAQLSRLCSADLAEQTAFYNPASRLGTRNKLFLNGEESDEGRAFAHVVEGRDKGVSFELPRIGKQAWENVVACPTAQDKTLVIAIDDTTPGQVFAYIGEKQATGNDADRAGLTNGGLFGIKVPNVPVEGRTTGLNGETRFELAPLGDVSNMTEAQLDAAGDAVGVTYFLRPEDGAWDPSSPRDFYFVTTDRFNSKTTVGRSRLYRLRFDDLANPQNGGQIEALLDGTEGQQMMDNLTIDRFGNVLVQEDPGNQTHLARIWQYSIATDALTVIAEHSPAFFLGAGALTQDEESSGIIDASSMIGPGWFLLTQQAHYNVGGELVQGGQMLALYNPDSDR